MAALALAVAGCNDTSATQTPPAASPGTDAASTPASAITVTDDLGQTVTLDAPPRRIATTAAFAVDYLVALGHPPVLRPDVPEARARPAGAGEIPALAVSHGAGPNLEQLAAARPDLVVTTPTFARFAPTIKQTLGVPVLVLRIDSLEDVSRKAKWFGQLIGEPEAGRALASRLGERIDAIQPPPGAESPTVFAMFGTPQASFAFLPDSYLGSMVEHLGGRLITDGLEPTQMSSQLTPFSLEVLVQKDPDVIVMVHHGPPGEQSQQLESRPVWGTLRAVKNGRVHTLPLPLFMTNPGPAAAEALTTLRAVLYPNAEAGDGG